MGKPEFGAPHPQDLLGFGASTETISCSGTAGSVYSRSFVLEKHSNFGLEVQFSSDTTVDVVVELEQSNSRPATEQAADSNFVTVSETISSDLYEITDENVHFLPVAPAVSVYGRIKFTMQTGNGVTTKCTRLNWNRVEV